MSARPAAVTIVEVGPRDGLQNEEPVPTESKVAQAMVRFPPNRWIIHIEG